MATPVRPLQGSLRMLGNKLSASAIGTEMLQITWIAKAKIAAGKPIPSAGMNPGSSWRSPRKFGLNSDWSAIPSSNSA